MGFNPMAGRAGKLYRDVTLAELAMEEAIARVGVPYRIQFPYYLWGVRYFPDFLLPTLKLIIEVDDDSHNEKAKKEADQQRTQELNALGWTVVRCTNQEALDDAPGILKNMLREAGRNPLIPICTLRNGLPQKIQKKKRGVLRQERLSRMNQKPSLPQKKLPQTVSKLTNSLTVMN